jgi:hypothetical protein
MLLLPVLVASALALVFPRRPFRRFRPLVRVAAIKPFLPVLEEQYEEEHRLSVLGA